MVWKPDYTTLADAKAFLRIGDLVDDSFLSTCITSASRAIDIATRRQFGNETVAVSREYRIKRPRRKLTQFAVIDDIYDLTDIIVTLDDVDITTECEFFPLNAVSNGLVYTDVEVPAQGTDLVITALWGWESIPAPITQATLMMLNRLFSRRDAPFGVIGSAELGNQMMIARNDPDVKALCNVYYRWWT